MYFNTHPQKMQLFFSIFFRILVRLKLDADSWEKSGKNHENEKGAGRFGYETDRPGHGGPGAVAGAGGASRRVARSAGGGAGAGGYARHGGASAGQDGRAGPGQAPGDLYHPDPGGGGDKGGRGLSPGSGGGGRRAGGAAGAGGPGPGPGAGGRAGPSPPMPSVPGSTTAPWSPAIWWAGCRSSSAICARWPLWRRR